MMHIDRDVFLLGAEDGHNQSLEMLFRQRKTKAGFKRQAVGNRSGMSAFGT